MGPLLIAGIAGVVAGVVASAAMEAYQTGAAPLFGQGGSNDDPSTVKAADSASRLATGTPVTQRRRQRAGRDVHYATGTALGLLYAVVALFWPPVTIAFGAAFGIVVAILLDDFAVPAFGWGPPPWRTPPATHLYSLSAHLVFGVALEGVRRLVVALLG